MRVPTANVIVSFSASAMTEVFKEGGTFKSLVEGIRKNKAVTLFDAESNPNFISFEHIINMGGEGPQMKLTFIDPKGNFESRFMNSNILDAYAGQESFGEESFAEHDDLLALHWKGITQKNIDELPEDFFGSLRQVYYQKYKERQLYVAYGSGEDLNTWASPHVVILTSADIIVEGAKKITLNLVPINKILSPGSRRGAYNEEVNIDLEGLLMKVEGRSNQIKFGISVGPGPTGGYAISKELGPWAIYRRTLIDDNVDAFDEQNELITALGYPKLAKVFQLADFHLIITDVIRNYIQKALSTPNVIVLLPNLNYVCHKVISEMGLLSREIKEDIETALELDIEAAVHGAPRPSLPGTYTRDANAIYYKKSLGKFFDFVGKVLKYFGLSLSKIPIENITSDVQSSISDPVIRDRWLTTSGFSYGDRELSFFQENYFFSRLVNVSKTIPNHQKVLDSVKNKIRAATAGIYPIQFATFYESDVRLLNLWAQKGELYKYSPFGGNRKFSPDKGAVIWGDLSLISQFLYGRSNLQAVETQISKLKENAEAASSKRGAHWPGWEGADLSEVPETQNFIAAAENLAPFHPLDKAILFDQEYNDEVAKIINPTIEGTFAFGNPANVPSDMEYLFEFTPEGKEKLTKDNIPIFKYNTENPNILDLTFKFAGVYFDELGSGYRKDMWRRAGAVAEGIIETKYAEVPLRTVGSALLYLRHAEYAFNSGGDERLAAMEKVAAKLHPDLIESLGSWHTRKGQKEASDMTFAQGLSRYEQGTKEYAAEMIFWYLDQLNQVVDKPEIVLNQFLPGDAIGSLTNMGQQLYRKALRMDIKSLPMFHLSNYGTMMNPCIVFAQNTPIIQTEGVRRSRLNTFFSGAYQIVGFRHVISSDQSFSEFALTKEPTDYNIQDETTLDPESFDMLAGDA